MLCLRDLGGRARGGPLLAGAISDRALLAAVLELGNGLADSASFARGARVLHVGVSLAALLALLLDLSGLSSLSA
eukprot:15439636-Alexandrium_andersonii.AAC.1